MPNPTPVYYHHWSEYYLDYSDQHYNCFVISTRQTMLIKLMEVHRRPDLRMGALREMITSGMAWILRGAKPID